MHQPRSIEKGMQISWKYRWKSNVMISWKAWTSASDEHLRTGMENSKYRSGKTCAFGPKMKKTFENSKENILYFLMKISMENCPKSFPEFFTASSRQVNTYGRKDPFSKYFLDFGLGILRWSLLSTILSTFVQIGIGYINR